MTEDFASAVVREVERLEMQWGNFVRVRVRVLGVVRDRRHLA